MATWKWIFFLVFFLSVPWVNIILAVSATVFIYFASSPALMSTASYATVLKVQLLISISCLLHERRKTKDDSLIDDWRLTIDDRTTASECQWKNSSWIRRARATKQKRRVLLDRKIYRPRFAIHVRNTHVILIIVCYYRLYSC